MWLAAGDLGGCAAARMNRSPLPAGTGQGEVGQRDTNAGREDLGDWTHIGAVAGAILWNARRRMQENRTLVAFLAGMALAEAYRELLRVAAADRPGLRATAEEIEREALDRVGTLAGLPLDGAGEINSVMDQVRALASTHWTGGRRTAPRAAEPQAPAALVASRRRGRPIAAE